MDMGANGERFRVWAPEASRVDLAVDSGDVPMERQADGTWTATVRSVRRYKFRLDGKDAFPDPYSRFQPEGVHGPSEVIDPAFDWRHDAAPRQRRMKGQVIYECHIGTFTPEGTFAAAAQKLGYLRDLGVTALEIMPVAEFSGWRNWGYDGVDWFAVTRAYGGPRALKELVDAAHGQGLAVLLDVVYNHFGPEGNYLRQFSPDYFTERYHTPWGGAINYEGCPWARKLATDNVRYWLAEYHLDGFRCDATFAIYDASPKHLLAELAEAARTANPQAILIAETHENDPKYFHQYGFDAVWADDFHHAMRHRLAGDHEGYYGDYEGTGEEVARTLNQGFLYEGQRSKYSGQPRGHPARGEDAWRFVYCLQNHDQVGNRAFGDRLSYNIGQDLYRAASAVLLLAPYTPMLFMGQEFAASSPFQYFTDHSGDLGPLVTKGRREEFRHFAAFSDPAAMERIPDPQAESTFERSKLPWREVDNAPGRELHALYQALLRLRASDPVFAAQDRSTMRAEAHQDVLAVSFGGGARLLVANLGQSGASLPAAPNYHVLLDSNDGRFGGSGKKTAELRSDSLVIDSGSAVVLSR